MRTYTTVYSQLHSANCLIRSVNWPCRKVKDLKYTTIANGHGPILRHNLEELVGRYRGWSEAVGKAAASVAVMYSSDYGYSDRWADRQHVRGPVQLLTGMCGATRVFPLRYGMQSRAKLPMVRSPAYMAPSLSPNIHAG